MQSRFALGSDSYPILRRKADVELEYELLKCLKLLLNHEVQHRLYTTGMHLADLDFYRVAQTTPSHIRRQYTRSPAL
jgi:hypothetical protein